MVIASPVLLAGRAVARQVGGDVALLLILDASGPMQARLGNGSRIAAAKDPVRDLVRALPRSHARGEEPARLPIYILSFLGGASLGAAAVAVRLKLREPAKELRRGL
jgi:hypothetical protein